MNFVKVTNDVAFRKIFGNENKKGILISFLNAVLKFPADRQIINITIENPYQLPELVSARVTIVDVRVKDQAGNSFLVEMQVADEAHFAKRILAYTARSYGQQLGAGEDFSQLKPVYLIAILNFNFDTHTDYHSIHRIINVKTQEHILKDIEFHFIELKKFTKSDSEISDLFEEWIYFVKNAHSLKNLPHNITDSGLQEAYQLANSMVWTPRELQRYEEMANSDIIYNNMVIKAIENGKKEIEAISIQKGRELGIQEGKAIGMEKGLKEGIEKGEAIGIEKGEAIGIEKGKLLANIELAKKFKNKGVPMQDIISFTELTEEEINSL